MLWNNRHAWRGGGGESIMNRPAKTECWTATRRFLYSYIWHDRETVIINSTSSRIASRAYIVTILYPEYDASLSLYIPSLGPNLVVARNWARDTSNIHCTGEYLFSSLC